jgi:hypothetical protein
VQVWSSPQYAPLPQDPSAVQLVPHVEGASAVSQTFVVPELQSQAISAKPVAAIEKRERNHELRAP